MSIFGSHPPPEPAEGIAANGRPRESVWDYPRPPRIEPVDRRVRVSLGGERIADSTRASRVLETAGAPVVYLPEEEIAAGVLRPASGSSFCEWKGSATYYDVVAGGESGLQRRLGLPRPDPALRRHRRVRLVLPGAGRVPARRRAGRAPARRLLRRLGDGRDHRADQGRARLRRLVTSAARRRLPELESGALGIDRPGEAPELRILWPLDHLDSG